MPIVHGLKMLAEVSWNDIFVFISKFSEFPDCKWQKIVLGGLGPRSENGVLKK